MLKKIALLVLVAFVGLAVLYRMFGEGPPMGPPPQTGAMPVLVAHAEAKTFKPSYDFSGRLSAVSDVDVRPKVGGTIEQILFAEGQMVKDGQPLFRLEGTTVTAAAEEARLAYQRGMVLRKQDAISAAELQTRKTAYVRTNQDLKHLTVTAPVAGRVGRAELTVGNTVAAGQVILTTIQQIDPLYVDFDMSEQEYLSLVANGGGLGALLKAPVEVALANDGAAYSRTATLTAVDNQMGATSGSMRLRATLANDDGELLPGLFARVKVTLPVSQTALLVNDAAIGTDQTYRFVWVMDKDNKPQQKRVTLGPMVDGLRAVTEGVTASDSIIVNGLMRVRPGANLTPVAADMRTLEAKGPVSGR